MKKFEGKVVWLMPIGNNKRTPEILKAVITKVAKVNMKILIGRDAVERSYRFDGNRFRNYTNTGYEAFGSKEEIEAIYEKEDLCSLISSECRYPHLLKDRSIDALRKIYALLQEEK